MGMAKRGKEMRMKRNQKGFTIVELLIAVAILSIVVVTVCGFILVGSRSYAAGNSDINVQQESQLALNQMSDLLIDTTRSVTYTGFDAGGTTSETALKDADFTFTPEDKSLVMLNGTAVANPSGGAPTIEEGNGNKNYHFYWDKSEETLFYAEAKAEDPVPDFGDPAAEWVVLAGHVTDFSADLSQVAEKRVVMLALTFTDGTKEYVTSNNVTIRNKVGVNDAKLDPINKKKTLNITPRDNPIVEPGETYHFSTPKVTGENVTDRSVTWSLATAGGNSPSHGTTFTDDQNGILQVATDEPAGVLDVVVTTNATDSDGNHASCTVPVHIKRVYPEGTGVVLAKTSDTDAENGANEISPGCTFTITATVSGYKLGEVCSVCGDDVTMDKQVSYKDNPYGNPYPWLIHDPSAVPGATTDWKPQKHIDIVDSGPDHATFYLHPDAPTSDDSVTYDVVIQAMSILSTQPNAASGRQYDTWVPGSIRLKMVKHDDEAEPLSGELSYSNDGDEGGGNRPVGPREDIVAQGVPEWKYVTCIRAVDLSNNPDPDKILLYFTIDGGADFRVAPSLLDLNLNKKYRFYVQALSPVNKTNLKNGNTHTADSNQEIWEEYISHLNPRKPYGYRGSKYVYSKVYYGDLNKPAGIWNYKGKDYGDKGRKEELFYDPVNVYVAQNGVLVDYIEPVNFKSMGSTSNPDPIKKKMTYSVYRGEGSDKSQWDALYWFDGSEGVMAYKGSKEIGGGVGKIGLGDAPGQPNPLGMFLKVENGDRQKVCGTYNIVPGFCYDNSFFRGTKNYEVIGWQGFSECEYAAGKAFVLPHKMKYYEFGDIVIRIKVTSDFTMEINHDRFKGKVMFPLPSEMEKNPLFPNFRSLEWQTSSGPLTVPALDQGNNGSNRTFSYIKYRYIERDNAWEVEPLEEEIRASERKIRTYSYGVYKCRAGDKEWSFMNSNPATDRPLVCNLEGITINGNTRKMYFPLPSENGFPFKSGVTNVDCNASHVVFDDAGNVDQGWLQNNNVRIKYEHVGNVHRIMFVNKHHEPQEFAAYECTDGASGWTKIRPK